MGQFRTRSFSQVIEKLAGLFGEVYPFIGFQAWPLNLEGCDHVGVIARERVITRPLLSSVVMFVTALRVSGIRELTKVSRLLW